MKKLLLVLGLLIPAIVIAQSEGGVWDNPAGIYTNIPVLDSRAGIGSLKNPLAFLFVEDQTIVGDQAVVGNQSVTGDLAVGGDSAVTGDSTSASYKLADGSDKNLSLTTYGSGTGYSLTNTPAAVDMGTSDPTMVLSKAGTYYVTARLNLQYVGATFAANRTVTLKLRRTNNTAADITGSSTALGTNIVTTVDGTMASVTLPPVIVTTANTNDIIVPYADVSVVPSAGSLQVTEAAIVAIRLY